MKWTEVTKLATTHGLEIYSPYSGYHRQIQIIDPVAQKHYWTANKAIAAHQTLTAIIKQKELDKLTDEEAIAQSNEAKQFF